MYNRKHKFVELWAVKKIKIRQKELIVIFYLKPSFCKNKELQIKYLHWPFVASLEHTMELGREQESVMSDIGLWGSCKYNKRVPLKKSELGAVNFYPDAPSTSECKETWRQRSCMNAIEKCVSAFG